jgi:uncharacterized protein (DUF362 family)
MSRTRREFLALAGAGVVCAQQRASAFFGLHPFIEANPKAVFILRTNLRDKMDSARKLEAGLKLARDVFVPLEKPGVPVTHRIILKPNHTSVRDPRRPASDTWGTGTDPDFYEGVILGLKELGLRKFHFIEANQRERWNWRGLHDINDRHGVLMNDPEQPVRNFRRDGQLVWSKVPDAVVYSRIPHFAPVNEPDTWLLNIAKWKAHGMCLTQSVKNEQGLIPQPYVRFCSSWRMVTGVPDLMKPDMHPEVEARVKRYFENHRRIGYARYDTANVSPDPMAQEIWAHKTCDNQSVLKTGLALIEGLYGRDGNGFEIGNDYLTNMVMFSKDKFRLDVIGLWLGGHEPGNVNLYRIARERGLSDTFNPWEIPLYEWKDGSAAPRKLTDFQRTPLRTYYLQRDNEPLYHLVDEPFDYDKYRI